MPGHGENGFVDGYAIVGAGVHQPGALMFVEGGGYFFRNQRLSIEWLHDHANGQVVPAAKLEVALVMRRDGHNRPSPVFHQDEIPYPDRKLFAVEGIGGMAAGEEAFLLSGG